MTCFLTTKFERNVKGKEIWDNVHFLSFQRDSVAKISELKRGKPLSKWCQNGLKLRSYRSGFVFFPFCFRSFLIFNQHFSKFLFPISHTFTKRNRFHPSKLFFTREKNIFSPLYLNRHPFQPDSRYSRDITKQNLSMSIRMPNSIPIPHPSSGYLGEGWGAPPRRERREALDSSLLLVIDTKTQVGISTFLSNQSSNSFDGNDAILKQ